MRKISLKEKIAGMLLVGIQNKKMVPFVIDLIKNAKIGGVILYKRDYSNLQEMVELINELKKANKKNPFPLIISVDQEGGRVNRFPVEFKNFTSAFKIAKKDEKIIKEYSNTIAEILNKLGVNMNFAPVLDLKMQPDKMAIGDRAFSKDPLVVTSIGKKLCESHLKNNVIPVVKHFPGHGSVNVDSHFWLPVISDYETIEKRDLLPFENLILDKTVDAIMVGHLLIKKKTSGMPASISKKFIQNEIRKKYNYEGIIMTDELGMRSVSILYGKYRSVKKAYLAGNDIICLKYSKNYVEKVIKMMERKASLNPVLEKQINKSFERILELKTKYNLSDDVITNDIDVEKYNSIIEKINK